MTEFTPGPWLAPESNPHTVMAAFGPKNDESSGPDYYADLATVTPGQPSTSYPPQQSVANAQLIAAAPDMYEALDKLCSSGPHDHRAEDWANARAALAKAQGEDA